MIGATLVRITQFSAGPSLARLSAAIVGALVMFGACEGSASFVGPEHSKPGSQNASDAPRILATVGDPDCKQVALVGVDPEARWFAAKFSACSDGGNRFETFSRSGKRLWFLNTQGSTSRYDAGNPTQLGNQSLPRNAWPLPDGTLLYQVRAATRESSDGQPPGEGAVVFHADILDPLKPGLRGGPIHFPSASHAIAYGSVSPSGKTMATVDFEYGRQSKLIPSMPLSVSLHDVGVAQGAFRRFTLSGIREKLGLGADEIWWPTLIAWIGNSDLLLVGLRFRGDGNPPRGVLAARMSIKDADTLQPVAAWSLAPGDLPADNAGVHYLVASPEGTFATVGSEIQQESGYPVDVFRIYSSDGTLIKKEAACLAWRIRSEPPCDQRIDGLWWPYFSSDGEHWIARRGLGSIEIGSVREARPDRSIPARLFSLDEIRDVGVATGTGDVVVCSKAKCTLATVF